MHIKFWTAVLIILAGELAASQEFNIAGLPEHPRILFQKEDEKELLNCLSGNNHVAELHRLIMETSDEMMNSEPVTYNKTGKRLLPVSRTCLRRVIFLSYSYRLTQDIKYKERAEKEMLAAASFSDWNPDHFLDVAEMTTALAIGYDWLYPQLSDESRAVIRDAILNKGLLPSKSDMYNEWLEKVNNWNQVCNGGLSLGAMAIFESEPLIAGEILTRAMNSLKLPQQEYEPDGAYPEGSTYWAYGTMYHVLFIDAFRKIFTGGNQPEIGNGFMKSGYFFLHIFGPEGSFNYSDSREDNEYAPAIFWYAGELRDNSVLFNQNRLLDDLMQDDEYIPGENSQDRFLPMIPIWASRSGDLEMNEPLVKSWTGDGNNPVSFHRTSWDDQGIYIGIKGGSPSLSHAHMDMGSFVMDAQGVRWAMDLGKHDYYELESRGMEIWNREQNSDRWKIFRYSNYSHNTLTVNGGLQQVEGQASIIRSSAREDFRSTVLDLSSAYRGQLQSAFRGIAIVDDNHVTIRDEIRNVNAASTIRWAMLTHDNIELIGDGHAVIRKDGRELNFYVLEPRNVQIRTYSTKPSNEYEDENPGTALIGFEVDMKAGEEQALVVMLVPGGSIIPEKTKAGKLSHWR